ncbi:21102_t:CDS:2 [Dentiscutata erythropus]|uniref:21102_t:CDS:1 n=1 Tax=Dentiscutata erythropus TaxID=1348616 RepID=A0A9N8ZZF0_9GLOM|nr:21102_t:CDS:2 [Dentiscutata erythropus]
MITIVPTLTNFNFLFSSTSDFNCTSLIASSLRPVSDFNCTSLIASSLRPVSDFNCTLLVTSSLRLGWRLQFYLRLQISIFFKFDQVGDSICTYIYKFQFFLLFDWVGDFNYTLLVTSFLRPVGDFNCTLLVTSSLQPGW